MTPTSICVPRGSLSCLLQWKSSLRSANRSDSGSFQMTPSSLGLRACQILCALFEIGVSLSLWLCCMQAPLDFNARCLGSWSFWCSILNGGAQREAWTPHFLGITGRPLLHSWLSSHLWVAILGYVFYCDCTTVLCCDCTTLTHLAVPLYL